MLQDLQNKVIAITGATGGIGYAIAAMLAREGALLAITGRDSEKRLHLEKELAAFGTKVFSCVMDTIVESSVEEFFTKTRQHYGRLDALIHVPGLSIPGVISKSSVSDLETMLDVNVKGFFLAAKHFTIQADPAVGGNIIVISSVASLKANPTAPGYCAAKAAESMLAHGLALQVKESKIRVTCVNPGAVDTPFWGTRAVPREKFMQAEDVAEVVRFILRMPSRVVMHDITFESHEFFK